MNDDEGRTLCKVMGAYYVIAAIVDIALRRWDWAAFAAGFAAVLWVTVWATRQRKKDNEDNDAIW